MRWLAPAIVLAVLIFYVMTLAPGLLWGDSAKFQRMAWEGELRFYETGHPLYVALAHPLTRIPGLDPAGACNLLSAILSALAIWPAFRIMHRLGASPAASTLACLALAVSHTFWFHAVVTEVYALNSLVTLLLLDRVMAASQEGAGAVSWMALGLCFGAATGNDLQVILWLPGYLWWIIVPRGAGAPGGPRVSRLWAAAAGFLLGLLPFAILRAGVQRGEPFFPLMERLLRQALMPRAPVHDALQLAAYLLYQFPVPIILAGAVAGAIRLRRKRPIDLTGLVILYAVNVLFAFSYQVPDRFAFYLPSYLVLALVAAPGLDLLWRRAFGEPRAVSRAAPIALTLLAAVMTPPIIYALAPAWIGSRMPGQLPEARSLPGRDVILFHAYPGKRGYEGARHFCLDALTPLPPHALLIADYTLHEPLVYMQLAEGVRPDVDVLYASTRRQVEVALDATRQGRQAYIAARDGFYDVAGLSTRFEIVPSGPIFALIPRHQPPSED